MTNQHRATPEQWAAQKAWAVDDDDSSCILELRDRVEALEAAQQSASAPPREIELELTRKVLVGDLTLAEATERLAKSSQVAAQHGPAPTDSLVERVAYLLDPDEPSCARGTARAAIREVAAWINERDLQIQNVPDCLEAPTADDVIRWLRNKANR
jgi:hypothetical protein